MRSTVWALALLLLSAIPARAGNWSIGSNFGFVLVPGGSFDHRVSVSAAGDVFYFMPGLRFGLQSTSQRQECFLDGGLSLLSSDEFSETAAQATANYQYNLGTGPSILYLTGGGGVATRFIGDLGPGGTTVNPVSFVGGGGVGVRHKVGEGHGTLRAEARLDYVTEGKDWDQVLIPKGTAFGVKLGFDLWLK